LTRRRRKAAERAIALGDDDPFDYELALELGWTWSQVQQLPHDEYVRWRAFAVWRKAQRDHARDVAEMRARR
jgi:hypothetical protein